MLVNQRSSRKKIIKFKMNAILLSAGFGSRLMPITKNIPKCMVKIGDEYLIDIWIKKLLKLISKKY